MKGPTITLLAGLLCAVLMFASGQAAEGPNARSCAWRTYELLEADAAGVVRLKFTGMGAASGDSIKVTVTPTVDLNLRIRVEPGTVLLSSVPSEQDMVVRRVRGKMITELHFEPSVDIEVECDETKTYVLEAYCLDRTKGMPSRTTMFTIGGRMPRDVAKVIAALPEHSEASVQAIQNAIWVATKDMSLSEVGSGVLSEDVQAREILTSAGLDASVETSDDVSQVLPLLALGLLLLVLTAILDL